MAELKPFEVIMRLYPITGQNGKGEICMKAERVSELIRCKDCKNWDKTWTPHFDPSYHYCSMIDGVREGNFYCADAERRTDE